MKIGKPIKYIAVPPSEVVERVKKNIRQEADVQTKTLESIKSSELIKELAELHSQGISIVEPSDLSGALKGRSSLYNHLEFMIKNAKKSVIIATTEQGLIRKSEALRQSMKKAKDKGVSIRIIAPITKESEKSVKNFKGVADVKHSSSLNSRFCVIDEKEIVFMLLDDSKVHPTYDAGVWVNTSFFAKTLQRFFDSEWDNLKAE